MPSVILLGVAVLNPAQWRWVAGRPILKKVLVVGLVAINAVDSAALLCTQSRSKAERDSARYIPSTEMEAYRWLDHEASEDDVVLSVGQTGHRLAKYASVRVVVGHWSVTPHFAEMHASAERFYRGELAPQAAAEFLKQRRVKWIYVGPNERRLGQPNMDLIPGFTKRVINSDVTVYSANR
jgi:hypothetical protein